MINYISPSIHINFSLANINKATQNPSFFTIHVSDIEKKNEFSQFCLNGRNCTLIVLLVFSLEILIYNHFKREKKSLL